MDGLILTIHSFVWSWRFGSGAKRPCPCYTAGVLSPDQSALLAHVPCREAGMLHPDAPPGYSWGRCSILGLGNALAPSVTLVSPEGEASLPSPGFIGAAARSQRARRAAVQRCMVHVHPGPVWPLVSMREGIRCRLINYSFPGYFRLRLLCVKPIWHCVSTMSIYIIKSGFCSNLQPRLFLMAKGGWNVHIAFEICLWTFLLAATTDHIS